MSPKVQRLVPPVMVIVFAVYLGWPPQSPLVEEDVVVRAQSVRWRPDDLVAPSVPVINKNPFQPVLVATEHLAVEEETGKLIPQTRPAGPPADDLVSGISLSGIAATGGNRWAVLNNRPCTTGDEVQTNDNHRHLCTVIHVGIDHVIVECVETRAVISVGDSVAQTQSVPTDQSEAAFHPIAPQEISPRDRDAQQAPAADQEPSPEQLQTLVELT